MSSTAPTPPAWRHRYAVFVAVSTFILVIAGGLVTSTGSGLAVPDWPLSFGQVFPRMEGGVLFEHGHRMIAAAIGFFTLILAVWTARAESRAWVRALGWAMLAAVIVQGLLGGLTVITKLPDAVSVSHAGLAQIFFSLSVIMASVTSPVFSGSGIGDQGSKGAFISGPRSPVPGPRDRTRTLALVTVVAVYAQILLGAIVRHTGAGLIIPDFPLAYGRLIPTFNNSLVAWHFAHRVGALVVAAVVTWTALRVLRAHRDEPWLVLPAASLLAIAAFQIFLGALTIWTRRAVVPTTAHVATGALLLVTAVILAIRTQRLFPEQQDRASEGLAPEPATP